MRIRFDAGPAEVHIFVLTLGYSRRAWAEGYEHERMESLLAAHENGFAHLKRNFLPGPTFHDLADFNGQLRAWLTEIADCRRHGTTHEPPIERYARERDALTPIAGRASFLQAMRRERVVADDWLVSIDSNRYSVPWRLIGKTVDVVRVGGH